MWGYPLGTPWTTETLWKAEPQEGSEIARAWIEDPMVYPGTPMPQCCRWVPRGQWQHTAISLKCCGAF